MENEKSYRVLGMCQELSPTGKEQAAFARLYNSLRAEGMDEELIINQLIHSLMDGRCYGNWPEAAQPAEGKSNN